MITNKLSRLILLLILMVLAVTDVSAKTFTIDNIIYMTYTDDPATAIVMGYKKKPVDVVIPATVICDDKEYTVTEISETAFKGCESLKTMVLPPTLEVLGFGAFQQCVSLESINIPDGVIGIPQGCFENCESLTSVNIPESVIEIGVAAFARCSSLRSATIPDAVTVLGQFAFNMCESLEYVKIGSGVTSVADHTFGSCISLIDFEVSPENEYIESPDGVLVDKINGVLVQYPLGNPRENYTMPDNVKTIAGGAFMAAKHIKHIVCPDTLIRIDDAAFNNCTPLVSISVGNSLQRIGGGAFAYCRSLERMDLPASVNDIAVQAFFLNTALKEYVVAEENQTYSSLDGVLFDKARATLIAYPCGSERKEYVFPETITDIMGHSFRGTVNLESVVINEGITTLPDAVFYECGALRKAHIPESVTLFSHWVFWGCSSLEEIAIPESVESMGSEAFYGCTSLMNVTSRRESPPYIGDNTFIGVPKDGTLYVPEGCVEVYRSAIGWDYFNNVMVTGTGVDEIFGSDTSRMTVYTPDGQYVAKDVDAAYLTTIPKGIYVINGKKIMVR